MGAVEVRRRAAWRFVRAIVRSQAGGVVGAVLSGLLWQTGAIAAPLIVSYTIDHGIVPRDRHTLVVWLLALLGVGLLEVVAGGMRHIYAIRNRSAADARVRDAIFAHALRLDGRTVVTIAHRLSTAERADRIVVMEHDRAVEVASHEALVEQGERYAKLWASWQAGLELTA
jgi:ABC-type bacteriocin/lantibiotic exporter with double-glycine peptidase domain